MKHGTCLRVITCCLLFTLLWSCRRNDKPRGLLEPKAMQSVMYDMMRADQFLSDFVLNKDSSKKRDAESARLYEQVLALHHISGEQFRQSLSWYREHPEMLRAVMDSISQPLRADTLPARVEPATAAPAAKPDTTVKPADLPVPARKLRDTLKPAREEVKKIAY